MDGLYHGDSHKAEKIEILKYLQEHIKERIWTASVFEYRVISLIIKNCQSEEDFQYFCKINDVKDCEWVFDKYDDNYRITPVWRKNIMNMLVVAIEHNNTVVIDTLINNLLPSMNIELPLNQCILDNNISVFHRLSKMCKCDNWTTILCSAVEENNIDIVKLACDSGADGTYRDYEALRSSIKHRRVEIANYLWNRFPLVKMT